jgi:hypothetical protein
MEEGVEEREEDDPKFAVPGEESHESPETLSPDERGAMENEPLPGPSEPKQPAPER